jgi:carboxypeptidase C (cathepsin A)
MTPIQKSIGRGTASADSGQQQECHARLGAEPSTFNCRLSTLFLPLSFDSAAPSTYNPAGSQESTRSNFPAGGNRMKKLFYLFIAGIILLFAQATRLAAQAPEGAAHAPEAKAPDKCDEKATKEESSVTDHTIKLGSQTIPYKATASTTLLKNDKGDATGLLYSVAYTRSDVKDLTTRPVSFLYNGGPGSATMWLHMGAFGPRRAWTVDGTFTPPAPYKLVDNGESLLDKTDLVFIDAMGTGYSHAVCKATEKDFYGVDEDVEAFAQFIVTYLSRNDRWNSPKFLIGESYGTFRSAALGNYLQSRDTVHLNGIVLISSVLDLSTITFPTGDDRSYIYYLPSYAAVAWYHKVLKDRPADLPAFIDEARKYAQGDYAAALFKGSELSAAEKTAVAKKLSYFTGLSEEYLSKADLRVNLSQFMAELQRSRGLTTGRIDARFSGYTFDLLEENAQGDPEGPAVGGAYTALINSYNHDELKFGKDKIYHNTSGGGGGWNFTRSSRGRGFFPSGPNVEGDLAQAMVTNPKLLVQVENGYYDMATPFFATEFTMEHLGLPADLQKNVKLDYYNAGHMMYLHDEDRVSLHDHIASFIDKATKP